jgi:(2S)-methylsuccinyl-CoA dehydrogenase
VEPEVDPAAEARRLLAVSQSLFQRMLEAARELSERGRRLDDHQVLTERIAYLATELQAAEALLRQSERAAAAGRDSDVSSLTALAYSGEVAQEILGLVRPDPAAMGLDAAALESLDASDVSAALRHAVATETLVEIGRETIASRGVNNSWLDNDAMALARETVRAFARAEVVPLAERIHRNDELLPDALIEKMAGLGLFAASIPEAYGGSGLGYGAMVVTTEELSAASLIAGSLSTRPEILARALLAGGTEEQRRAWLPRIASGELMVAISVTEPDAGSDVAALSTKAEPENRGGRDGWLINGTKAWSTFAGRAEILALLARTNPDASAGSRGLSMFIVPKSAHYGHDFEERQDDGGRLIGRAIATPGYRGMHSYILSFDNYFVPAENLIGGDAGIDRGFYLQMAGFAAGRLQTGGRALGVAQAALARGCEYVSERRQFGRSIGEFQLTQYRIGRIAIRIAAARQLTYAAANAMEQAERGSSNAGVAREADLQAAMCKLLASDVAVWAAQESQVLHGGWGYAEETPVSRYVVDAQVLPIFEGTKPVLELRVIGAGLLRG